MNIMMLCDEYPPGRHGGIGTVVQLLARAYVRQGHRVIVSGLYDWGYGQEDQFEDQGVLVYRFRFGLAAKWLEAKDSIYTRLTYRLLRISGLLQADIDRSLKRYKQHLEGLIEEHGIDIVEMPDFQEYMPYIKRETLFPKLSVPVVVKLHGSVTYFQKEAGKGVSDAIYQSERHILDQATAVSSVSIYTADRTAGYFNYRNQIEVLYNGIDIIPAAKGPRDPNLIIFTGSLVEKKGIYQLMKAWNIVHQANPQARLHIYGKGPVSRIQSLLSESAQPSVSFKGHVQRQELFIALGTAVAAVFPSFAECFALGPMEAMACNTTVIYSLRSSGPELITNGQDGLLVDPDNPEQIAEMILYLLTNKEAAIALANKGRQKIEQQFGIDHIASQHIVYYQRIISSK